MQHQAICRALDLGFGYTKFSMGGFTSSGLEMGAFPSYAPAFFDRGWPLDPSMVTVDVDGITRVAGPEAYLYASGSAVRLLDESFFTSTQVVALASAAFDKMNLPQGRIDHLAVNLPRFGNYDDLDQLEKRLLGRHVFRPHTETQPVTVEVKNVYMVPQVLASLDGLAREFEPHRQAKCRGENNLFIDVGYGSTHAVQCRGFDPIAVPFFVKAGGVDQLLEAVLRSISVDAAASFFLKDRLDKALITGKPSINASGQSVALAGHLGAMDAIIMADVKCVLKWLFDADSVQNVFVTGGEARFYVRTLRDVFGDCVFMSEGDNRFHTLKGLQHYAEWRGGQAMA